MVKLQIAYVEGSDKCMLDLTPLSGLPVYSGSLPGASPSSNFVSSVPVGVKLVVHLPILVHSILEDFILSVPTFVGVICIDFLRVFKLRRDPCARARGVPGWLGFILKTYLVLLPMLHVILSNDRPSSGVGFV
jgi:hypothetical protein